MTASRRASGALALGSVVSGLLAYLLFALFTRGLGAEGAAPVSVLWTLWAFAGAALTFPIQHWITRSLAAGEESVVRRAAPRVCLVVVAGALLLGFLSWLVRDDLFGRQDAWFPVMVSLITVGSAVIGVVRGGLGGRGRFEAVAWSLVAENGLRCLLVGGLLLADVTDPVAHGLGLVAGQLVVVLWPSALRFTATSTDSSRPVAALAFLTGASLSQLVSQAVLTGAPVLLALSGGSPTEVTAMFAALALFRAPYLIAVGSVPQLTVRVTELGLAGEYAVLRALIRNLLALTVVAVVLAAALGAWLGPDLLRLVFGNTVDVPGGQAAVLAVGCTVAVTNLVLMVIGLAQDHPAPVTRAWAAATAVGAVGFGAFMVLTGMTPAETTVGAFLCAELAALAALSIVAIRATRSATARA